MEIEAGVQGLGGACNIGVTTGKAFCGSVGKPIRREYCVVGDVVIMSARLMASKENHGRIFCDQSTVTAVGQEIDFEILLPIKVKSRAAPVAVFNPRRLITAGAISEDNPQLLIGREQELATLLASARRLSGANPLGRIAVVNGAAGIGKSHLLRHMAKMVSKPGFIEDAHGLRPRVVVFFAAFGPAVAHGASMAAWMPVLRGCLGIDANIHDPIRIARQVDSFLEQHPPKDGSAVAKAQLEDILSGQTLCREEGDPVLEQQVAACAHVIETAAKVMPAGLCVIIEDAQHLESDSWTLVSKLAHRLHDSSGTSAPLLLILPMRANVEQYSDEERAILQEVLKMEPSQDTSCLLLLNPLSISNVEELVRSSTAVDAVDGEVTELMYNELLGVPQFTIEQLALLQLSGAFKVESQQETRKPMGCSRRVLRLVDATASRLALDVPYSLELGVTRGFAALYLRCQLSVQCAAAIGRTFSLMLLAAVHPDGLTTEEVLEDVNAAIKAGFIVPSASKLWDPGDDADAIIDHLYEFASNTVRIRP